MMGMGFGVGFILMIVLWILIIGLAISFLSILFPRVSDLSRSRENDSTESALDILKQRYARGEITETEYKKIKRELQNEMR